MILQDLIRQRYELNVNMLNFLRNEIDKIKVAGDDMVECATNIKGQGYSAFIESREKFLKQIDTLDQQLVHVNSFMTSGSHITNKVINTNTHM